MTNRLSTPFTRELAAVINRVSRENASNTPDFILAHYLADCLKAFERVIRARKTWNRTGKARRAEQVKRLVSEIDLVEQGRIEGINETIAAIEGGSFLTPTSPEATFANAVVKMLRRNLEQGVRPVGARVSYHAKGCKNVGTCPGCGDKWPTSTIAFHNKGCAIDSGCKGCVVLDPRQFIQHDVGCPVDVEARGCTCIYPNTVARPIDAQVKAPPSLTTFHKASCPPDDDCPGCDRAAPLPELEKIKHAPPFMLPPKRIDRDE